MTSKIPVVMSDIFADWKTSKFIVSEYQSGKHTVVLTDINYWTDNYYELCLWCKDYNCDVSGLTVDVTDDKILTMFILRWS